MAIAGTVVLGDRRSQGRQIFLVLNLLKHGIVYAVYLHLCDT